MDKAETYRYLDSRGIAYEVTEHPAVYSMAQLDQVALPYPADDAKNLFVRNAFRSTRLSPRTVMR